MTSAGQAQLRQTVLDAIVQAQQRTSDPQSRRMFDYLKTPQGLAITMLVWLILMALFFVLLSGAGGAFSASLLRRKEPPER
jgi:hypothetical protein